MVIGKVLGNRYHIVELLGEGGMALVYKAECSLLRRPVAVKILRSQYANDSEFVERFRREAQAAASLSHPNVVNIYDVGNEDGIDYIVMEYVAGENLKELIRREAPFSVRRALTIAAQICEALQHAHQHNIIHRDIKPHNILITPEGRVKVTDFGIARAVSASGMTQTGMVFGSVQYFSPEQAEGGIVGTQSDLYSLGCVLYEMLTGKVPFTGESPIAIALKHIQEEPVPVERLRLGIPPAVSRIVEKALAKPLSERYSTAYAMLREIHAALGSEMLIMEGETEDLPTQAIAAVTPEKPSRKQPWFKWLAYALSVIAIMALTGFGLKLAIKPRAAVEVPDLRGMTLDEATRVAGEHQLKVEVARRVFHSEIAEGRVVAQEPEANRKIRIGREIKLTLSRGYEMVIVPDLIGKSQLEAELALESSRLRLGDIYMEPNNEIPKNYVARQKPEAGTSIQKDARIDLYLSLGPNVDTVKVPNFIGRQLAEVQAELAGLGLVFNKATPEVSAFPEGQILDQQPAPGTDVPLGTAMSFVVSAGQFGGASPGSPSAASAEMRQGRIHVRIDSGPALQHVKIVVADSQGHRTVYRGKHQPGERVDVPVQVTGPAKAYVYLDNVLKGEEVIP